MNAPDCRSLTDALLLLHDLGGPVPELGLHGGVRQEAGVGRHGSAVAHGGVAVGVAVAVDRESVRTAVGHLGGSGGSGGGGGGSGGRVGGSVVDGAEGAAAVAAAAVSVGHAVVVVPVRGAAVRPAAEELRIEI